jgi:hypothetical protein
MIYELTINLAQTNQLAVVAQQTTVEAKQLAQEAVEKVGMAVSQAFLSTQQKMEHVEAHLGARREKLEQEYDTETANQAMRKRLVNVARMPVVELDDRVHSMVNGMPAPRHNHPPSSTT